LVESTDQMPGYIELLAVHDFDLKNGLEGPEHQQARSKPWRSRILQMVERRDSKVWISSTSSRPATIAHRQML